MTWPSVWPFDHGEAIAVRIAARSLRAASANAALWGRCERAQLRFLKCQLSLPVSTISQSLVTVTASAMLKRLSGFPRANGLAVALREMGRLERSIFMLNWLRELDLRRRTQGGLNKVEARNALARAIFFCQLGELRNRRFENQSYRASGLNPDSPRQPRLGAVECLDLAFLIH